ncbi:MAG: AAA family ATPase [Flavobacteriales bacterium]|nr:AAA family ATPase [Flavobacteriales bacterium]
MIKRVVFENFKQFASFDKPLKASGITIVAGGNNSGKSSLLHGLAVWEFAKLFIELEKGRTALNSNYNGDGIGISFDDFTPINIPSLKYLWTNLTGLNGYQLKIKCFWDLPGKPDRFLEISFSLVSERLYMKNTSSNLAIEDKIPVIAYLPPFAGITDREPWYSVADRRKLLGRGLGGSILRNTIIDMFQQNERRRVQLKGDNQRISKTALRTLRETDPYEKLNQVLFEIFKIQLHPLNFNSNFHNYVRVELSKGEIVTNRYVPFPNFNKRDIMVEGSGFLQWLSVYTYALDRNIDVLLLDEPDAHLHTSLESVLFQKLADLSSENNKQVLMATHSSEIIKRSDPKLILKIQRNQTTYLVNEGQKVALISGLGSEYSPILNKLQVHRKVIFTENESDWGIIKEWFRATGVPLPNNIVVWPNTFKHDQRKQLFIQLREAIPDLKGISIEDRDNLLYEETTTTLQQNGFPDWINGDGFLRYRKWRRWEIENYLIHPSSIARAANVDENAIRQFIQDNFGIIINGNFIQSDRIDITRLLFDIEGKILLNAIERHFNINKHQIAHVMIDAEVFDDARTLVNEISAFSNL